MKILLYALLAFGLWLTACCNNCYETNVLIPAPVEMIPGRGVFDFSHGLRVHAKDSLLAPAVEYLSAALADEGIAFLSDDMAPNLTLLLEPSLAPQAYRLAVTPDAIVIQGGSYGGVAAAVATLRQLLWCAPQRLHAVEIVDAPRFAWRGAMLDVARHFFTVQEVKSLLDRMALYKLNRLHLHLSDDQGWRVEIKRYPRLTEMGAWRLPDKHDSLCIARAVALRDSKFLLPQERMCGERYGGYYTQEQVRELVDYAAQRGIEIVPEIDLPGHSLAALGAYPALSCDGGGGAWGENFSTPLCLGNDATIEFCRNVLQEIFALFPSGYIHVGGDEVERTVWEHCATCRARIETEGLTGSEELQAWFTRELERFCRSYGKTLIGWDEVVDDGLTPESMVMWWRSWSLGSLTDALQQGQRVILTPSEYYYLNGEQDRNSLAKVYNWESEVGSLLEREKLIVGIQGNLWTEEVPSVEVAGERLFPRLLAVAETGWCHPEAKDFASFESRLPLHLRMLERSGWNYRMADIGGICDRNVFSGRKRVELKVPDGAALYYTLDGTLPDTASVRYTSPLVIDSDCTLTMRCYNARGVAGGIRSVTFEKVDYAAAIEMESLPEGVLVRWYDFRGECCADIDKAPLKGNFIGERIAIPEDVVGDIGLIFDGYIEVPADGTYSFYTYSDDGSVLEIGGRVVVDNDGLHSRLERSGQAALRRGMHKFSLRYFDSNGGVLETGLIHDDGSRSPLTDKMLKH